MDRFFVYRSAVSFGFSFSVSGGSGRRCSVQRATVDLWRRCCLTVWTALMARWACCWMVFTPVGGSGL